MSGKLVYDKFWTKHSGQLPDALQLVRTIRSTQGHVGWRINTHGYDAYLNHIGFYDGSGIITGRTVYYPADQNYADAYVVKAYDPASTKYLGMSNEYSMLTVFDITIPLHVRKITLKSKNGVGVPVRLSVEVSDNTTSGGDGDWIPHLHLTDPFNGNVGSFITIPIPLGISYGFNFGGIAKSNGDLEDCITGFDAGASDPLPSANHGIVEFADFDELMTWQHCFTRPTLFKTLNDGKVFIWNPEENPAGTHTRELA